MYIIREYREKQASVINDLKKEEGEDKDLFTFSKENITLKNVLSSLGLVTSYLQHDKYEQGSSQLSHQTANITQPEGKMAYQ